MPVAGEPVPNAIGTGSAPPGADVSGGAGGGERGAVRSRKDFYQESYHLEPVWVLV